MVSLKMVKQTPKHIGGSCDKHMYLTYYVHLVGIRIVMYCTKYCNWRISHCESFTLDSSGLSWFLVR